MKRVIAMILVVGLLMALCGGCGVNGQANSTVADPKSDELIFGDSGNEQENFPAAASSDYGSVEAALPADGAASDPALSGDTEKPEEVEQIVSEKTGLILEVPKEYLTEITVDEPFRYTIIAMDEGEVVWEDSVFTFRDENNLENGGVIFNVYVLPVGERKLSAFDTMDVSFIINEVLIGETPEGTEQHYDVFVVVFGASCPDDCGPMYDENDREKAQSYYDHAVAGLEMLRRMAEINGLTPREGWPSWEQKYQRWIITPMEKVLKYWREE